ncbi:MAG: protein kinase [Bacteroidetes bacterium]|nr:protein kinase [Bacteroidota bacterium]
MIGKSISHYKIIEKLGGGGMGVVYKAEDSKLDRFVALKFLPPELTRDEESKKRFIHEAKAASALEHTNICNIHEIDETDDGQIFIVMSSYEGETLKKKIERGPLKIDNAIDITIQIAEGLVKAHESDIIHRDIKPANIFITNDGVVKILDFGLAKVVGQTQLTQLGTTSGTVAYMSPEQTKGEEVDNRTDIWSLGVVFYEMLSGTLPFKGDYDQAIIYSIINEYPDFISKIRADIPLQIENIISKILDKNPEKCYQSMNQLLENLQKTLKEINEGRSKKEPILKFHRKHFKLAICFYTFIVITPMSLIGYFWFSNDDLTKPVLIALLPLKNITTNSEQEWFTDGMTDAIITDLARISGLRVISRYSVMKYKNSNKISSEIAEDLGVSYIIEGSVVKIEDQVRIRIRLIEVSSNEYLWAEDYEGNFTNVLDLQSRIAREIAEEIKVKLTSQEQILLTSNNTINPEAYEAYLKGNFYLYQLSKEALITALQYYNLALQLDGNYALAYAGIAQVWMFRAQMGYIPMATASENVKPFAEKALELDSNLAEVHYMLAVMYTFGEWKWDLAIQEWENTLRLNPNFAEARAFYSHALFILNRPYEAIYQIGYALELDPFNDLLKNLYAMGLMYAHRYDDVIELLEKRLKADASDPLALSTLKSAYHQTKMYEKALEIWRASFEVKGDQEAIDALNRGNLEGGYNIALKRVAETMIERSKTKFVTPWQIATLYTRAGMYNEALNWFNKAYDAHDPNIPYLNVDPIFDDLRQDDLFKSLLNKIGFPN